MSGLYVGKAIPALLFGKAVHAVVVEVDDYGNRIALSVLPPGLDSPKTLFTCRLTEESTTGAVVEGVAHLEAWVTRDGVPFGPWYAANAMTMPDFIPGGVIPEGTVIQRKGRDYD